MVRCSGRWSDDADVEAEWRDQYTVFSTSTQVCMFTVPEIENSSRTSCAKLGTRPQCFLNDNDE